MIRLSTPSILLFAAAGCQSVAPVVTELPYPKLSVNQAILEFGSLSFGETAERTVTLTNDGGMQMGIGSSDADRTGLDIGPGMAGYSVTYDPEAIVCPEGVESLAGSFYADTGSGETGGSDPVAQVDERALFTLGPACSLPVTVTFRPELVGESWGSVGIGSVSAEQTEEQASAEELPAYLRDPVRFFQQVYLHGEGRAGEGILWVTPLTVDFGYSYPGRASATERIEVRNLGTAALTLAGASLSDCDPGFALLSSFPNDHVLAAGENALVEIVYTPPDEGAAYCSLNVTSDAPVNGERRVTLKANTSSAAPGNVAPTVAIRSPAPGYAYDSANPLELELNLFDSDQPASSLICRVTSLLQGANIATCAATDDSGHLIVSIPRTDLTSGVDTLAVVVTDASGVSAQASVSLLVNTPYPDSDDDGDAYGLPGDCDDHERETYPGAAELFDAADNDCDGLIDEGTAGADDDGDGIAEVDGDCDDANLQSMPGAPERVDGADNDCDGVVDEGTNVYDDDGDGFADVNGDCDDADAAVNPAASELCDGLDNDCDGFRDYADACRETDSAPVVVGYPQPAQNACLEGERVAITVRSFDVDGQAPTFAWRSSEPAVSAVFDNAAAATVNFTCPALSADSSGGRNVTVAVIVQDPDGNQAWQQADVAVFPADYPLYAPYTTVTLP